MTEILLQQLEDKTISLVAALDKCRGELKQLQQEYAVLKSTHESYNKKLQGLLDLIDSTSNNNVSHELLIS
jgi:FtsZ-binding cell division protein ZapB